MRVTDQIQKWFIFTVPKVNEYGIVPLERVAKL